MGHGRNKKGQQTKRIRKHSCQWPDVLCLFLDWILCEVMKFFKPGNELLYNGNKHLKSWAKNKFEYAVLPHEQSASRAILYYIYLWGRINLLSEYKVLHWNVFIAINSKCDLVSTNRIYLLLWCFLFCAGWTFSEKVGDQLHLLKPTISGCVTIYGIYSYIFYVSLSIYVPLK